MKTKIIRALAAIIFLALLAISCYYTGYIAFASQEVKSFSVGDVIFLNTIGGFFIIVLVVMICIVIYSFATFDDKKK